MTATSFNHPIPQPRWTDGQGCANPARLFPLCFTTFPQSPLQVNHPTNLPVTGLQISLHQPVD